MNDQQLTELLPWYVNGTLTDDEKAEVDALLERSESAQQELQFLKQIEQQVRAEASAVTPTEMGWRRLQKDITKERSAQIKTRKPSWWGVAAALVIAIQVGVIGYQHDLTSSQAELLSGLNTTSKDQMLIQLQFVPDISLKQAINTIQKVNGHIVEGPSSLGIFTVGLPQQFDHFKTPAEAISWLKDTADVQFVAIQPAE